MCYNLNYLEQLTSFYYCTGPIQVLYEYSFLDLFRVTRENGREVVCYDVLMSKRLIFKSRDQKDLMLKYVNFIVVVVSTCL